MPDYQLSKIYKIDVPGHGVYVGSTTKPFLSQRRSRHVEASKIPKKMNRLIYQAINQLDSKWLGIKLELVESYPCSSINELRQRKAHWIRLLNANLNIVVPGRTQKEYREDNRERRCAVMKKWYQQNRDEQLEKAKTTGRVCYEQNKEKLAARRAENVKCPEFDKELRRDSCINHLRIVHKNPLANCPECNKELQKDSIPRHLKAIHNSTIS
jgi:hypothetical protein